MNEPRDPDLRYEGDLLTASQRYRLAVVSVICSAIAVVAVAVGLTIYNVNRIEVCAATPARAEIGSCR